MLWREVKIYYSATGIKSGSVPIRGVRITDVRNAAHRTKEHFPDVGTALIALQECLTGRWIIRKDVLRWGCACGAETRSNQNEAEKNIAPNARQKEPTPAGNGGNG